MTTAYGLYDDAGRWLAWVPCGSVPEARSIARQAVKDGHGARYVVYNRAGLAVEDGGREEVVDA